MYALLCGDVDGVAGAGASDGPASLVELQELGALQLLLSSRCPQAPAVYLTLTFTPSTISHLHYTSSSRTLSYFSHAFPPLYFTLRARICS